MAVLTQRELMQRWVTYLKGESSAYDLHIRNVSKYYGCDPYLVKAVIKAESRFDHEAVSASGAMGLMQLMPSTAKDLGVKDPYDPRENIEGGVKYLKALLNRFDNDLSLALAAYNAGPETVKRYGTVPPFQETRDYLQKVLKYYSEYKEHT
jgi:soluble lytic murein transglycosylase